MSVTLAQLTTPQTVEQIFQILLGYYQAAGFPVQSWQPFGVERTRLMAISTAINSLSANYVPTITAGGFLDLAEALPSQAWLQALAESQFDIDYNQATQTVGNILLTASAGAPTQSYAGGQLIAYFGATGNRYLNVGTVAIAPSTAVSASFVAEQAGASYNDPNNSGSISLVTSIPGVTLTNPPSVYSSVTHAGSGTGTVTPSASLPGAPFGNHQVVVQITGTGPVGTAAWETSLDGGAYISQGTATTITNLGGTGINITLANGASGVSFVIGDTYIFNAPGSWVTSAGSNIESSASLAQRCRNRWSSLSSIPTNSFYQLLVTSTPGVGSQVTQVVVVVDGIIPNKVNIIVAGPQGALPSATISTIQAYVNPRVPITEMPVVQSPTSLSIVIAATITIQAALLTAAQPIINTALLNYIDGIGINGVIRRSAIIDVVMNVTGVIDITGVTINGIGGNLTLGSSSTFVVAEAETNSLVFVGQ